MVEKHISFETEADAHKSSDFEETLRQDMETLRQDEDILRQLVLDMWTCIWAAGLGDTAEGKRLRLAMIEALNLDE